MIDLEKKLYRKSAKPPFKKTCPCTISPPFLIFQSLPLREVIKLYSPPLKKVCVCVCVCVRGWGFPNYELAKKNRTIFLLLTGFTLVLKDQDNSWGATYLNNTVQTIFTKMYDA